MKDIKRLATGAVLSNTNDGLLNVTFVPWEAGEYNLHPKQIDDGLILQDPNRPAAYALKINGDSASLRRIANALNAVARAQDGDASPARDDDPADTDA